MTAEIDGDLVKVGSFNPGRVSQLSNQTWIPIDVLVTTRFSEVRNGQQKDTYYAVAWLLTHWFQSDSARRTQLDAYVAAVRSGTPSAEALQTATGLSAEGLRRVLQTYLKTSLSVVGGEVERLPGDITVTRLSPAADDLLLLGQRLKGGVSRERRAETVAAVRRAASRHPDDLLALRLLGHAEVLYGDPVEGERLLTQVLERDPDDVQALRLMARRRATQAGETPDQAVELLGRARAYLARAYQADPTNYYTLYLLARSREKAADYPNDNDLATWVQAYNQAPQMPAIRLGLAAATMRQGEYDLAVTLLEPLANSSHGGGGAEAAQALLTRAKAGQPPLDNAAAETPPTPDAAKPGPDDPAT